MLAHKCGKTGSVARGSQVLANVVSNVVDSVEQGAVVAVEGKLEQPLHPNVEQRYNCLIHITVRDTCMGTPKAGMPKLLRQGQESMSRKHGGTSGCPILRLVEDGDNFNGLGSVEDKRCGRRGKEGKRIKGEERGGTGDEMRRVLFSFLDDLGVGG